VQVKPEPSSKRSQIVQAALRHYRTFGVGGTTLKDVSEASGVPLGNLYYYFKTRGELVMAALDECERELQALLDELAPLPPAAWLAAYFEWLLQDPAAAARFGCPFGALALELRALSDPAAQRAADIVGRYFKAVGAQVRALQQPSTCSDDLFIAIQGAYAVSRVMNDASFFQESVKRLRAQMLPEDAP